MQDRSFAQIKRQLYLITFELNFSTIERERMRGREREGEEIKNKEFK